MTHKYISERVSDNDKNESDNVIEQNCFVLGLFVVSNDNAIVRL